MRITLQQLRYCNAIADAGSMIAASRRLKVAQPTLSEAVSLVERELGFSVFERSSLGVKPTDRGIEFLARSRQIVQQMDNLDERYGSGESDRLRFAVSCQHYSFAERAFVDLMGRISDSRYQLVLNETQTMQVIENVASCEFDMGVLFLSRSNEAAVGRLLERNKLEFHELFEAVPHALMRCGHPLAGEETVSTEQLAPYPQLTFLQGLYESSALAEEPLWAPSEKAVQVSDRGLLMSALLHSDAYTVTSGVHAEYMGTSSVSAVPVRSGERMHVGYVMVRGADMDPVAEQFIELMKRYAGVA